MRKAERTPVTVALVLVLTCVFLVTCLSTVKASVETSIEYFVIYPDPCGPNMQVVVAASIIPPPPSGYVYENIEYAIIPPVGGNATGKVNSDRQGSFYFFYTPTVLGTHWVNITWPETILGTLYASCTRTKSFLVNNTGFYMSIFSDFFRQHSITDINLKRGQSTTVYPMLFTWGEFDKEVDLSVSSLPTQGPKAVFNHSRDITSQGFDSWSNLTITTSSATQTGAYLPTLNGVGVETRYSSQYFFTIYVSDFSISVSQTSPNPKPGESVSYIVNVTSLASFNGTVSLDVSGSLPPNATPAFQNKEIIFSPVYNTAEPYSKSTMLTVATSAATLPSLYNLTITGTEGGLIHQKTVSLNVTTEPVAPIANFTINPSSLEINKPVTFNASISIDPDGDIKSFIWDFGDGTTATGEVVNHIFTIAQNYNVTLAVKDQTGIEGTYLVTLAVAESNPEPQSLWLVLISAVGLSIFIVFFAWRILRKRKEMSKFSIGVLPKGWQFYEGLTEGFPPGTVFRISNDKGRQIVGTIKQPEYGLEVSECAEVVGDYTQTATMNTLIQFTGLNTKSLDKMKDTQSLTLEMPGLTRETTSDVNLDPLVEQLLINKKIRIRNSDRYYVIREARKALEINYQLKQGQIEDLGGEASLSKVKLKGKNLFYSKQRQVINQKFTTPMRVMFHSEEIKLDHSSGKLKIIH